MSVTKDVYNISLKLVVSCNGLNKKVGYGGKIFFSLEFFSKASFIHFLYSLGVGRARFLRVKFLRAGLDGTKNIVSAIRLTHIVYQVDVSPSLDKLPNYSIMTVPHSCM